MDLDSTRERRLLIVDDEAGLRRSFVRLAQARARRKEMGIVVTEASDGQEGLEILKSVISGARERFDLVLTDNNMPALDGSDMLRRVAALSEDGLRGVANHTVIATGMISGVNQSTLPSGVEEVVEKPVDKAVFDRMLDDYLFA
ncbi:MAG: Response regulator receiver [uncultured bacterium]|nr:MAG: Response regulator receiver [uncultured bacterium]OGJ48215.1 MAG: hypothetical protein A2344_01270 [Candidatus Peregrinibacteria bacterium RIFOXYB12_FULL_41_12]OGJ48327.1 MAG: hypothetical protein A2244_02325 [Candidatus Peregrinibacteria bacterium RIFOXYA2_FULL_41_18]OGJ52854.1 MAG: hypothetical protein A2448_04605 [Candidatus Peregrinibacteria bacterium RIFOXYC2_FULL_41_22]OGJ54037.1 MAG: hypothetical protein A2336_00115 [Candidatus Peregrinibacteria bacterium RIFOXYB2_FULL_41_88]